MGPWVSSVIYTNQECNIISMKYVCFAVHFLVRIHKLEENENSYENLLIVFGYSA